MKVTWLLAVVSLCNLAWAAPVRPGPNGQDGFFAKVPAPGTNGQSSSLADLPLPRPNGLLEVPPTGKIGRSVSSAGIIFNNL